ncbi:hypothetical protein J9303_12845 [Bacillaceae bacterium Marseille-Q3522]|nr:hypothetical protein [Bacillaceae bacterium Marseille-Q3522]
MEMKPEIIEVLKKIDFPTRYKKLSDSSRENGKDVKDRMYEYDVEKIKEILNDLGYEASFDKKEKFFKVGVVDHSPRYSIWFNLILEGGRTTFVWTVFRNKEVRLGRPWIAYSKHIENPNEKIRTPVYRSYKELEVILREAFVLYEDFKRELIAIYEKEDDK